MIDTFMEKENIDSNIDMVLCKNIIHYLNDQREKMDSYEGLILGISNSEVNRFNRKLLNSLVYLLTNGFIEEYKDKLGKKFYKIKSSNNNLSE